MNLVVCTENCAHQKDGICTLEHSFYVNSKAHNGCHYYTNAQPQKEKSPKK